MYNDGRKKIEFNGLLNLMEVRPKVNRAEPTFENFVGIELLESPWKILSSVYARSQRSIVHDRARVSHLCVSKRNLLHSESFRYYHDLLLLLRQASISLANA